MKYLKDGMLHQKYVTVMYSAHKNISVPFKFSNQHPFYRNVHVLTYTLLCILHYYNLLENIVEKLVSPILKIKGMTVTV